MCWLYHSRLSQSSVNNFVSSERVTLSVLDMQVKQGAGLSINVLDQVFGELPNRPNRPSRPKYIEDLLWAPRGLCPEWFHLPAKLMTWSQYGSCSKPLSQKQLHHSVARRWSVLVTVAAKELKEVLTEDRDLPSPVGMGSVEKNWQARKAAAEVAAEQRPHIHSYRWCPLDIYIPGMLSDIGCDWSVISTSSIPGKNVFFFSINRETIW